MRAVRERVLEGRRHKQRRRTARGAGTIPGELRVATQRSPNTLNPILSANTTEGFVNRLSFDTLVSVDARRQDHRADPRDRGSDEANGGISKDGLTITYHLHSGVRWHDGVAFSSKDVKFTWQAMMNTANNVNARVGYEDVESVDTPDANTVVFHLKRKFAPFVDTVFAESDNPVCILPEHLLAKFAEPQPYPVQPASDRYRSVQGGALGARRPHRSRRQRRLLPGQAQAAPHHRARDPG